MKSLASANLAVKCPASLEMALPTGLLVACIALSAFTTSQPAQAAEESNLSELSQLTSISAEQAARVADQVVFVDVRTTFEWLLGHIKGAVHLPLHDAADDAADRVDQALPDKTKPIVTYCAVGQRAQQAAEPLRRLGYTVLPLVGGGFNDLVEAGVPAD